MEQPAETPPQQPSSLTSRRRLAVFCIYLLIIVGWPMLSVMSGPNSPEDLRALVESSRLILYANTGVLLWGVFVLVWIGQQLGRRPIAELGFTEPRLIDPVIGFGFLIAANVLLNALGWVFEQTLGMEPPDMAVLAILPQDAAERIGWIILSVSAGICEESAFRGFLLLRGQRYLRGRIPSVLISSVAFATGHLYHGQSGATLIFIYGILFCILRYWQRSLWPGIWAHIWQDLGAMAFGQSLP